VIHKLWIFSILTFMLGFAITSHSQQKAPTDEGFPLDPGTYWIYRGTDYWTPQDARYPDGMKKVTWRTEVADVIVHPNGLIVAVVKGFPLALDQAEGQPQEDVVIKTSDGKFFHLKDVDLPTMNAMKRVKDPSDSLDGLLRDEDWFLQLPLSKGEKFCEQEQMKRSDDWYCWVTDAPRWLSLERVRGIKPTKKRMFGVRYATFPDDMRFEFVPGVGITKYEYHHHGYLYGTEISLTEFHPGKSSHN
jgi:hypothetical protein